MPTKKQLKAIDNLVENGGNVSKAMRDAGYSEATANTPQKLTESKAFQEIMADAITDKKLVKVIDEGLSATRTTWDGENHEAYETADHQTRHKFLETALKVKGVYRAENSSSTYTFTQINATMKGKYDD